MRSITLLLAASAIAVACQSTSPAAPGSVGNPLRVDAFRGQLAYLGRLRCRDGTIPQTQGLPQRHSRSHRPIRGFRVRCIYLNEEVELFFDAHHPGHVEQRAVAGFELSGY